MIRIAFYLVTISLTGLMSVSLAGSLSTRQGDNFRLAYHYSVAQGWLNDPNGLVYHNGAYHLFYQYNPAGTKWGPMHWGHAQSTDLIHWRDLPVALKPTAMGQAFSGCGLVDTNNVTGLATAEATEPLIAIFTLHSENGLERQGLAYSLDEGLTWTQYAANPIVNNPNLVNFRDPNIIRRPSGEYVMSLTGGDRIMFYKSSNLLNWEFMSEFGASPSEGDKSGVWECPSLFTLKDEAGNEHDILVVSENGPTRGSVTQYFVGKFNGTAFQNANGEASVLWADHGPDNYAAIPYSNDPKGRIVMIGWMNNWLYGQDIPTTTWRGQMTVPRVMSLKTVDNVVYMTQWPSQEVDSLREPEQVYNMTGEIAITGEETIDVSGSMNFSTPLMDLDYEFDLGNATHGRIGLRFSNNLGEFIIITYSLDDRTYRFERRYSGIINFSPRFAETKEVPRLGKSNTLTGRILLDMTSVEIFADDGLNTITGLFFPHAPLSNVQIYSSVGDKNHYVIWKRLQVRGLKSIRSES